MAVNLQYPMQMWLLDLHQLVKELSTQVNGVSAISSSEATEMVKKLNNSIVEGIKQCQEYAKRNP